MSYFLFSLFLKTLLTLKLKVQPSFMFIIRFSKDSVRTILGVTNVSQTQVQLVFRKLHRTKSWSGIEPMTLAVLTTSLTDTDTVYVLKTKTLCIPVLNRQ